MSVDCVSRTIGGLLCIANAGIFATLVGMATVNIGKHHGITPCGASSCAVLAAGPTTKVTFPARVSGLTKVTDGKKI